MDCGAANSPIPGEEDVAEGFAQAYRELAKMSDYKAKNFQRVLATTDTSVEEGLRCVYEIIMHCEREFLVCCKSYSIFIGRIVR
jgi:hypothetical protein